MTAALCACGCGRLLRGRQRRWASPACRAAARRSGHDRQEPLDVMPDPDDADQIRRWLIRIALESVVAARQRGELSASAWDYYRRGLQRLAGDAPPDVAADPLDELAEALRR